MRLHPLPLLLLAACGEVVLGPPVEPVTSVVITAPERAKVGDPYPLVATARLADGTVVSRPVAWAVVTAGKGTISAAGVLVPSDTGALAVRATVGGVSATAAITGYDWRATSDATSQLLRLASDNALVDRFGALVRPDLVALCVAGTFWVIVVADGMEIVDGAVQYGLGDQPLQSDTWVATAAGALLHPGTSNAAHKGFAAAIAAESRFRFRFREQQGEHHLVTFRVTGLGGKLAPLLAGCPSGV